MFSQCKVIVRKHGENCNIAGNMVAPHIPGSMSIGMVALCSVVLLIKQEDIGTRKGGH